MLTKYGFIVLSAVLSLFFAPLVHGQALKVCATVPELGSLVQEIGGAHVDVTVFAKGTENPTLLSPSRASSKP